MSIKNIVLINIQVMLMAFFSSNISAAEGDVGPVYLSAVIAVAINSGGHLAGNFEIHVKGGFTIPNGLTCNNIYITTLKSVDADKRLFSLLVAAHVTKQPLYLRITDDPAYTAFQGRCSLVWAALAT